MSEGLPERIKLHQIQGGEDLHGPAGVPGRLLASWQRSEDYGISLEAVKPVFAGTERSGVDDDLFFQCGNEVLTDLHRTLSGEPVSMMLTDADGVVLSRLSGDRQLLAALDEVYLAPGFAYAERDVGTNGLGLALADRAPTLVRADQHYAQNLNTFTCAAVPVLDPGTGRLEGSVNLTTWSESSSDLLLALARSAASNTTALMLARAGGRMPRSVSGHDRAARCSGSRFRSWNRRRERCIHCRRRGTPRRPRPGVPWRRARSCWPSGKRAPGAPRCSARRPGRRIRVIASCRPAHRIPTMCRPGWGCGLRNSARPTLRSSCVRSTCCRYGWPSDCGIWCCAAVPDRDDRGPSR